MSANIKGVIYDLDGTIILTADLHENSWKVAGKHYGLEFTEEFLRNQKGATDEASAREALGSRYNEHGRTLIQLKRSHTAQSARNSNAIKIFEGFSEAFRELKKKNIDEWICTSAPKEFVAAVFDNLTELSPLKDTAVFREMYTNGKPDPEPILLTANLMGIPIQSCVYVGDAYNDYLAATAAGCKFIYFCRDLVDKDPRIPENIPIISNHNQILPFVST